MNGVDGIIVILLVGVLLGFIMLSLQFVELVRVTREQTEIVRAILLFLLSE